MGGDIEDNTVGGIFNNDEEEEESRSGRMRARIFVGGLGGTVTAEDLRNTFSSLGELESVEIVRSKGRSFAYFDFLPSSPKSLSKLFSTYNGCMWKGGRLRLEKAKEHYLLRLKRELAEDAKLANSAPNNAVDATKNTGSSEKLNNGLNPEKMEFRLFFPKLKKVKPLPVSGTGKHKYSFQRVEVPPLPIHFCDCEKHYDHSLTVTRKDFSNLETLGGGVDEKELNMMVSVMNKLFERENNLKAACSGAGLFKEGDIAPKSSDENETDLMTDEDNLVMNMVAGGKSKTALLGSWGQETLLANEEAIVNELRTSKDSPSENVLKSQRMKIAPSDKKRKSPLAEETDGNETLSSNPERKGSVKKTKLESGIQQSNTNISWSQKSSWRDLAGKRGNTSFCISHIIQSTAPTKEESKSDDDAKVPHFAEHQDQNLGKNPTKEESKSDGVDAPHFTEHQNQNPVEESRNDYGVDDLPFTEHQNQNPVEESRSEDGVDVLPFTEHQNQDKVKNINLESQSCQSQEPNEDVSQPNKPNMALNKPARGALWLQKSSWTQLVGDTNSSFSISQLLPGMTFEEQERVEPKRMDASNSTVNNYSKLVKPGISKSPGDGSKASGVGKEGIPTVPESSNIVVLAAGLDPEPSPPQQNMQNSKEPNEITAAKKNHAAPGQPSIRNNMIGETCSFMRSDASMREWAKTKAALSGSIKKKNKL